MSARVAVERHPMYRATTDVPVEALPGTGQALVAARRLRANGSDWCRASIGAIVEIYGVHSVNAESLGGDLRRIWKWLCEEVRK